MSLTDQLAAFKKRVQSQPVLAKHHPATAPGSTASSPSSATLSDSGNRKRRRLKNTVVYSTPADTGSGSHLLSNLTYALEYLKRSDTRKTIDEINSYLSLPPTTALFELLSRHEKVDFDSSTKTFAFRPMHNIRSTYDLLQFLRNNEGGKGLPLKELKDGWPEALDEVLRLEADRQILVIRARKDDSPRLVWPNDKSKDVKVDEEFKELWHSLPVPPTPDLPHELERVNLKPTSVDPASVKRTSAPKPQKQKRVRRGKITNTHLPGILRDYSNNKPG